MKRTGNMVEPKRGRSASTFNNPCARPHRYAQIDTSKGQAGTLIEFRIEAPNAHSVKLAADFTDWEKAAIKLVNKGNGIWGMQLPLPPGRYAYRFLIDGDWHDDPRCAGRVPNDFGTSNSVIEVV